MRDAAIILIYMLLLIFGTVCIFGGGLFIMDFFGFLLDDLFGGHGYFYWTFS